MKTLKRLIKSLLKSINLYYFKPCNLPENTLLGLKNYPIKTVIDIGSNKGQFAIFVSKIFPNAQLYCFEPLSDSFRKLKDWSINGNAMVFNLALGCDSGEVDINIHSDHDSSSSLLKTTAVCESLYPETQKQKIERVKLTTLDNAMSDYIDELEQDLLIKLDVQGYEDRVIRGGINTFSRAKVVIMEVSINQLYENQASFVELVKLMSDQGFKYVGNLKQYYLDDGSVSFLDAVFTKI